MQPQRAYSGRPRRRSTSRAVWLVDILSRWVITIGGLSTIIAVATVFVFLLYVVIPLFRAPSLTAETEAPAPWKAGPAQLGVDEDQLMSWAMLPDGTLQLVRLETGEVMQRRRLFDEDPALTAWSFPPAGAEAAFGFSDGSVRTGTIHFGGNLVEPGDLPEACRNLPIGQSARFKDGMVLRTPQGQYRVQELAVDLKEPAKPQRRSPVVLLDQSTTTTGLVLCVLTADGKLRLNTVREQKNLLNDEVVLKLSGVDLLYAEPLGKGRPKYLFLSAVGDQVCLFWEDGTLMRYDARVRAHPLVAETRNVLDNPSLRITAVSCLIGKGTYLVGDSSGRIRAWFFVNGTNPGTSDGGQMVCAHEFAGPGAAVTALAPSERTRMAAAAYADGQVRLLYVTSDRRLLDLGTNGQPAGCLALAPKDDGLVAAGGGGLWHWSYDPRHPEISVASLFDKVWYEGYEQPSYTWQSSSGSDAFEPKFGLMPLIYGTLKASFYSLLFGVPLALLAAVFTSEFLNPRTKAVIKPTIELMAGLPSVVLGFLAGLVLAQFIEGVVPAVLATVVTVPLAFVVGAYLWQLLPQKVSLALARWRFLFIVLCLPAGLGAAVVLGPVLERLLFAGDLRAWLDGRTGNSAGCWGYLLLPICALAIAVLMGQVVNPRLRRHVAALTRGPAALLALAKFAAGAALTLALAWILANLFQAVGLDPRGTFVGPYSQRNALVVGLVMGFAIIPIIYTISEDALSAVPEHLRAGSLAAGATRWQTATRIIIPTAMSGLFSAVMIGMGRAVGETMIVLMATGNTPVMDWSIFSGFRTLSANIAVELPEAVKDSTHFRTLFFAALVLFAITFVLNTVAELVRLRFRRRAYQL